jgi:hypothetical protein
MTGNIGPGEYMVQGEFDDIAYEQKLDDSVLENGYWDVDIDLGEYKNQGTKRGVRFK